MSVLGAATRRDRRFPRPGAALLLAAALAATAAAVLRLPALAPEGTAAPRASVVAEGPTVVAGRVGAVRRDGDVVVLHVVRRNGTAFDAVLSPTARLRLPGGAEAVAGLLAGTDHRLVRLHLDRDRTVVAVDDFGR